MSEHPNPAVYRLRRRSRAEVVELVATYAQSGLSRLEFCRQHGLSLSSLNRYRQNARHRDRAPSVPTPRHEADLSLLPVEFVEERHELPGTTLFVELRGRRRIGVAAGFDATTLARLIAVLEQA